MNCGHGVDERVAGLQASGRSKHARRNLWIAHNDSIDETHHIKRRIIYRNVIAHCKSWGYWHLGVLQRRDHTVFATHVVRAGKSMAQWRPAQHIVMVGAIGHAKREVGVTACDEFKMKRCN